MFNLSKLSEQLKELMEEKGLNQSQLANAMQTPRAKLSSYLTAHRAPNYESFIALVEFFHCSADYLMGYIEYPNETAHYLPVVPFGERFRKLLAERNVSQYAFVKDTQTSWNVIHRWLTGKSFPSLDNLDRIATYLGCSIDYLLGRTNDYNLK